MIVSISRLKTFKACRRAFELHYIEGLRPVVEAEALQTGRKYHELIERLFAGADIEEEQTKEFAMFEAFRKYVAPKLPAYTPEVVISYDINGEDALTGRLDGIADIGGECVLIEHKTTSSDNLEEYEFDLQVDEQIPAYMLATGARRMFYTVCKKPTIRQKKNETDEEFFERMKEWYDEDTTQKIRCFIVERTDEEVEQFRSELVDLVDEVRNTKRYYRNTLHCFRFGRRCEYASICANYDPTQEYIEFTKEEKNELEENHT